MRLQTSLVIFVILVSSLQCALSSDQCTKDDCEMPVEETNSNRKYSRGNIKIQGAHLFFANFNFPFISR